MVLLRFLPCLSIWFLSATEHGRRVDRKNYYLVHFGFFVCPPWYLMSYCRCWVYYPGMYYIFCCFESVTGRTHLHWHYRTFKARFIRCGARLGLRPASLIPISLFALQTQFCLFIINLYLQFRLKLIKVWSPRRLAYRTFFICNFCSCVRATLQIT